MQQPSNLISSSAAIEQSDLEREMALRHKKTPAEKGEPAAANQTLTLNPDSITSGD